MAKKISIDTEWFPECKVFDLPYLFNGRNELLRVYESPYGKKYQPREVKTPSKPGQPELKKVSMISLDKQKQPPYTYVHQKQYLIKSKGDKVLIKTDTGTDIVAVGECLVDFVSGQHADTLVLEGHPGGAPANVLAMAAKLRCSTQMIAKVGMDAFGSFLIEQLKKAKIGTTGMVQAKKEPTTLAIVSLDTTGNRSFGFYRNGMADVQLEFSEIDKTLLKTCRIFHFGSVSMTSEPARSATLKAALMAKQAGALISYDPNLRAPLWEYLAQAKKMILEGMHLADVVKLSGEELEFLSSADLKTGTELLYQKYKMKLLAITLGPDGCVCRMKQGFFTSATFDVSCVDTTGAGDAFWGAVLASISKEPILLENYSHEQINALLDFANAAGALATTKKGAIPAMPNENQIQNCIETMPRCRQGT